MRSLYKNKKFVAIYLFWALLHTTLLLSSTKDGYESMPQRYFWPLSATGFTEIYDFSEWFFYMAAPLVIIYGYKVFTDKEENNE